MPSKKQRARVKRSGSAGGARSRGDGGPGRGASASASAAAAAAAAASRAAFESLGHVESPRNCVVADFPRDSEDPTEVYTAWQEISFQNVTFKIPSSVTVWG
jgi:hypothetical protein